MIYDTLPLLEMVDHRPAFACHDNQLHGPRHAGERLRSCDSGVRPE